MRNIDQRIKSIKWVGLGLLILTALSTKLYLTFHRHSLEFTKLEKYTIALSIMQSPVSNWTIYGSDSVTLKKIFKQIVNPYRRPEFVSVLELVDSIPSESARLINCEVDLMGGGLHRLLIERNIDSSYIGVENVRFLNRIIYRDSNYSLWPPELLPKYIYYLCSASLSSGFPRKEEIISFPRSGIPQKYIMVFASGRPSKPLDIGSIDERGVYFFDDKFTCNTVQTLRLTILQIAENFNITPQSPVDAYRLIRTKWRNESITVPVLNLNIPAPIATSFLLLIAFCYSLLLSSNLRQLAQNEEFERNEPWIIIERPQSTPPFIIGKLSFWAETFLSRVFYLSIILSPLVIGILSLLLQSESTYMEIYTYGIWFLMVMTLFPTISSFYCLSMIFKKNFKAGPQLK